MDEALTEMATPGRDPNQPDDEGTGDRAILNEAKDRFDAVREWESTFRGLYIADVKFANGDSDNGWQWPDDVLGARGGSGGRDVNPRPCLTINKVAQLVLQITNESRKNKPSIKIRPTGEHDSYEAAETFEGVIRYIERMSKAQAIYDEAVESQVEGGIAYMRVQTVYVSDDSFDQDIRIEPVRNHLNVYLDRDIKQKDGSDARYAFLFDELSEKDFKAQHPGVDVATTTGFDMADDWVKNGNIRVAEYYRIVEVPDELIYMEDAQGVGATFRRSEVPAPWRAALKVAEATKAGYLKVRKVKRKNLEWYKIAGDKIIDRQKLKGTYIPIARLVGREKVIEGRLERKGHVRPLKDPQRMYNYNSSGQVEYGALGTKTPWVVAAKGIEGNQQAWFDANRKNAAVLTYQHYDQENGTPIPPPIRPEPPGASPAFLEGMKIAMAELEMASGQGMPQQANPSIERTPRAVDAREARTETSTYHFMDNLAIAIAHLGNIILDLIPHYYDTERVVQILAKDGTQRTVHVDPNASDPYQEQETNDKDETKAIWNPKVGKYQVEADIGPAYASQRQEAWNAFFQIVSKSPDLTAKIGDIGFEVADFPKADVIAERLRRDIRANAPWLLDDNEVGPFVKQLQASITQLQQESAKKDQTIAELLTNLAECNIQIRGKSEMRNIQAEDSRTKRLDVLIRAMEKLTLTPKDQARMEHELLANAHAASLDMVTQANISELESTGAGNEGQ